MPAEPGSRRRIYKLEPDRKKRNSQLYVDPHSTWQLMIEEAREKNGISLNALSESVKIPRSTIFNWLRREKGAPPRHQYTANVNRRIAEYLKIDPEALSDAYNQSAFKPVDPHVDEPGPAPGGQEAPIGYNVDGMVRLLAMLKASGGTTFTLAEIEMMASLIKPADGQEA